MLHLCNFARRFNVCGLRPFDVNFVLRKTFVLITKSSPDVVHKQHSASAVNGEQKRLVIMPEKDVMQPRAAGRYIAEHSLDIKVSQDGVEKTAKKIVGMMKSSEAVLDVSRWDQHVLNPKTRDKAAIDWVFVIDLLNFSFWSDEADDLPKYCVSYAGRQWTGYWSLCAAFNRAVDEGIAITDPRMYGSITREQLVHLLRSDVPGTCMPLIDERLASLHTAGTTLCQRFGGSFVNVIAECDSSARKLLQLIVDNFPTFRDVATFNGKTVAFYKRAQILVGDVWACCGGTGYGAFSDIDALTAFADYRVPQLLVCFDVLQYSVSLRHTLHNREVLPNGDRREVEIRGCTIWAVELLVQEINQLLQRDPECVRLKQVSAITVDHFLWDFRREHDISDVPFHRTRCIYY